jgi:hypothetical protein
MRQVKGGTQTEVYDNRVLTEIFNLRGKSKQETEENFIMRSCIICMLYQILLR